MKIEELQAISKGIPVLYNGRRYINRCNYRREFEIDEDILAILTPKTVDKEDGSKEPMLSKKGEPIMDYRVYIPFVGADGIKSVTQTKSPLIYRLIRNLPVKWSEKDEKGNTIIYYEGIEGKLRFGEGDYSYGDKTVPVVTLEAAEED